MVGAGVGAARIQCKRSAFDDSQMIFMYRFFKTLIEPDKDACHAAACVYTI
jgi:hypothetical protein